MKKSIHHILSILSPKERKIFFYQIFSEIVINFLDILFLAGLILFTGSISNGTVPGIRSEWYYFISQNPVFSLFIFCFLFCLKNILGYAISARENQFNYQIASRISKERAFGYLNSEFTNYSSVHTSSHIYQISQLPIEFSHYVLKGVQQIISQAVLILFAIAAILIYQTNLFLLLFILLLPSAFLISYLMKKKITLLRSKSKSANEKSMQFLQEALTGYVESKIHDKSDFFTSRYANSQLRLNNYLAGLQSLQNMPSRLMETFAIAGFFILVLFSRAYSTYFSLFTIGAFLAAAYKIIPAIVKIINASGQIKAYAFTIEELLLKRYKPLTLSYTESFSQIKSVEFINVSFGYGEHLIIKDLNFQMKQGDFIGISGSSGKGKTTIINLLLGFLDPVQGEILINNQLTTMNTRHSSFKKIAYVKQTPFLINDSLLKNINLEECTSDELAEQIAKVTGADQIVNGYGSLTNKIILEGGKNVSGGQRQRISLSRALYKNYDLIILDEPFSELDIVSERKITEHLKSLANEGKMILLISHKKESVSLCNKQIKIEE